MNLKIDGRLVEIAAEKIPRKMFVHCPLVSKLVRVGENCVTCHCFNNFVESDARAEEFKNRYHVVCGHPLARRMTEVEA